MADRGTHGTVVARHLCQSCGKRPASAVIHWRRSGVQHYICWRCPAPVDAREHVVGWRQAAAERERRGLGEFGPDHEDFHAAIARRGGETTKARHGAAFYARIGRAGGRASARTRTAVDTSTLVAQDARPEDTQPEGRP